jgi:two-component system phosphate regulon sensor histidine kinase PhoR
MRSDFIANASHELRTPISVLLGCIQTLRGSARDDPEAQAEFFGLMQTQAERMSRLVDDLLSLSRIELNEHTLPSEQVDVPHIVRQVVEALAFNAQARGIRIETDFPGELPTIPGDPDELSQVFQNLIDNAVKYGAEDSIVRITARVARDDIPPSLPGESACLAIAIRDHGEGIPPEHLPRLTERFYRVDTARSRELGGTGLGLAIVKHVVNRHRGALTIDSEPGEGSIFTVFLPAAGVKSEPAAA